MSCHLERTWLLPDEGQDKILLAHMSLGFARASELLEQPAGADLGSASGLFHAPVCICLGYVDPFLSHECLGIRILNPKDFVLWKFWEKWEECSILELPKKFCKS